MFSLLSFGLFVCEITQKLLSRLPLNLVEGCGMSQGGTHPIFIRLIFNMDRSDIFQLFHRFTTIHRA